MSPAELIRIKRDGQALSRAQIGAFVAGLTDQSWSDSQVGAMAMAILLRGMSTAETTALTDAMTHSGAVLDWSAAAFNGPVVDKHSTGGVGDKISLMLAPMLAACGAVVPMVSGRGLGHTGGTLDKLEALPGYGVRPGNDKLLHCLRSAGCAIFSASSSVAPADARLYAIRDLTATVESLPLITASILSKKRAAGLQALVLDVKFGSGAFMADPAAAQALARSLVDVASQAGLPATALLTDMNQVLGKHAGNALEVREAIEFLTGTVPRGPSAASDASSARQLELTLALGAELLMLSRLHASPSAARAALQHSLDSGAAAERFARMVAILGGPADVLRDAQLPTAPVQRTVPALRGGFVHSIDVRALGLAVVGLGGGRRLPADRVDPRVGLANVAPLGAAVMPGDALAVIHAASEPDAVAAVAAVQAAFTLGDSALAAPTPQPIVWQRITAP